VQRTFLFIIALCLCVVRGLGAFGMLGHQAIAAAAQDMLSPGARAALSGFAPADADLASISTRADDIKGARPETRKWHFIDIEITQAHYDPAKADTPNVAAALQQEIALLSDAHAPAAAREEALKWVVHLVGDAHQPLHAADNHDHGGNLQKVRLDGRVRNLHEVWDFVLLERTGVSLDGLKARLEADIAADPGFIPRNAQGTVAAWLDQTHAKAMDCYRMDGRQMDKDAVAELDPGYADRSTSVVLKQLELAAVRLAWTLNRALDPAHPGLPLLPRPDSAAPHPPAAHAVSDRAPEAAAAPSSASAVAPIAAGRYAWSLTSNAYHYADCADVARIKPENLRTGDAPPPGRHLHAGCPKHSQR